mgnify:CR=1 FL=1
MKRGCFDPSLANHTATPNRKRSRKRFIKKLAKCTNRKATVMRLRAMNYDDYLKTIHWKNTRTRAIKFYGSYCSICGNQHNLQVHHLNYKRIGREKLSDLQVLCGGCHANEHEGKSLFAKDPMTEEFVSLFR